MESWIYYVQSLIMGNGYVNLLWKLLLMDNGQGKQVIYYILNITHNNNNIVGDVSLVKLEQIMNMQAQEQLMVYLKEQAIYDLIYIDYCKVDQIGIINLALEQLSKNIYF